MSGDLRALLAVGTRLAYDGQWWQVTGIDGPHVLLSSPAGVRRVSAGHLLADPSARLDGAPGDPVEGAGADLAGLGEAGIAELRERVAHVREVRTGFRRGCAELAADGEPRPEYAPGVPMLARYAARASEIGVGVSTLRRWVKDFGESGPAGLADDRWKRRREPLAGADPRWLEMARQVLAEHAEASKPTRDLVLAEIAARLDAGHDGGTVPVPSPTRARILLREISKGTSAFGGTKGRREIAGRPATPCGRLRAVRPGEYLLLDTTRLDVFAMDPVTLRWVQAELSAAMDLYDRCITGLRLTPVSTKAVDAAGVLFESVRPLPEPADGQPDTRPPYHGLPGHVVIDGARLAGEDGQLLLPSVPAETVVVDHGKIYLSEHLMTACARLGISVQPARVCQATDKGPLERWFRTLGEQLLAALPGYKGPDVYRRGKNPEEQAFYFLDELERIVRQWTAECYHRQPHAGLCIPEVPGLEVSPLEMFARGIARAGYLQVPARADLALDFLKVEWRTIQHYGVEIGGLRYDGPALNPYRNRTSPYAGKHAGRWPLRLDPGDVSGVWFQDPADNQWHALRWEHAAAAGGPFSSEALAYARHLATAAHRFPGTRRALAELLEQRGAGLAGNRAERRMALRLSGQRLRLVPGPPPAAGAPEPAVTGDGGDDDSDSELGAPFPGEEPGGGPGDFYADAMETV
ncbi:MAG TPA: helix-turn-helix domain-containing protein [Streptosporangiaceae bacterium]|nr:helix-turn-helix domain-containing protein [Streptosporangiaceae bacterium]